KYSCQGHCIWRRSFHKAAMSKCPIPLYVVVSTKLNHPEITFGTAPFCIVKKINPEKCGKFTVNSQTYPHFPHRNPQNSVDKFTLNTEFSTSFPQIVENSVNS
ncbi:MAG: hypothetical protein MST12_04160, partial [Spirochaetia bacterium]|nr:hypothetical protein [Spirochaetia bacterium]